MSTLFYHEILQLFASFSRHLVHECIYVYTQVSNVQVLPLFMQFQLVQYIFFQMLPQLLRGKFQLVRNA